jgi:hypothetical protein
MPTRLPPFVLTDSHEVRANPQLDKDWTLSDDWDVELQRRYQRNVMCKEQLLAGRSICYRSGGNSLWPRVESNDLCTYAPVTAEVPIEVDDIVFCEVQPNDRFYAHLVKAIQVGEWEDTAYIISNARGRENGWCYRRHIYGKLVEVGGFPLRPVLFFSPCLSQTGVVT